MEVLSLIIKIVLCLISLFLVVVVLLQDNEQNNTVGGGGVSKKARGTSAFLAKLTKIAAITFMVLAVALVVLQRLS
ncbi:MAG: preprotein translocase subunit SecG [Clostridia bacterium]|jgi:preprotein translocase subunit SecG|nr:preprotein translocase subunit SecG [Clostridia bacterium]MBQ5956199.1 preprotein translocase subunit SecG [Clostridia bacterium]MBQ6003501.1 preprotein translocase subunit SecG [Clostridia bacterium]MBR0438781.1 preprotein translocase subunit SecG [Clostridia bacterium]MBR3563961.1 preprotein translocase subunit SecG [Clostridia bacterium]